MLDLLAGFIQELRSAGLPVSLTENLDAMEAVKHIPLEDREAFKYALAATLVKNHAHWKAFETIFEVYFSLRGSEFNIDGEGEGDIEGMINRMLGADPERANVNGGAVALGHPIGASGGRIVTTMINELSRNGGGVGLAAICSGGGQGDALLIEV